MHILEWDKTKFEDHQHNSLAVWIWQYITPLSFTGKMDMSMLSL